MSVPGIVQSRLDDEEIAARVPLGGDDELFVTPSSTLIYRADGLLSDESVDEFSHDADRLTLSEGRRKSRFSLEYPLDGVREFTVPASKTEAVLHPVLAGILNGNGITDPGETVEQTYRFSELTLIVTSNRLVKHIGEPVWDADFEQFHFEDVTNLSFEEGSVATQIVLEVDGRPQRIKAPNEQATDVSERLKRALFAYHDVDSLEALNEALGDDEDEEPREDPAVAFESGVDPLEATPSSSSDDESDRGGTAASAAGAAEATTEPGTTASTGDAGGGADTEDTEASADTDADDAAGFGDSGFQAATEAAQSGPSSSSSPSSGGSVDDLDAAALLARLERLEDVVAEQTTQIERQRETIERLIEELRQGR